MNEINETTLAAQQWAKGNLLNNADTNLDNFTTYESMINLGMNFILPPEAAFNEGCDPNLDMGQALALLNYTDFSNNEVTMMNPMNVKAFFDLID